MWTEFFLQHLHFTVYIFAAVVFFAIDWLYFDAWLGRRDRREVPLLVGYLLLALSFGVEATISDFAFLPNPLLATDITVQLIGIARFIGFLGIIYTIYIVPLTSRPRTPGITRRQFAPAAIVATSLFGIPYGNFFVAALYPALAYVTGLLYYRRTTAGLERQLGGITTGFFWLSVSSFFALAHLFRATSNVLIFRLVAPFGVIWLAEHVSLAVAVFLLGRWLWYYLLKRFESQLFLVFITTGVLFFLVTAVSFSTLLLNNLQQDKLASLATDARVLNLALESKAQETLSDAQLLAQNTALKNTLAGRDLSGLATLAQTTLLTKRDSILLIVNQSGQVFARGEDTERVGDSLSDDPLVRYVLTGRPASSVVTREGAFAPVVSVRSGAPVIAGDQVIGAVIVGTILDNAFVDNIKRATGLEAAVYGQNVLSATTQVAPDGTSRWIGVTETRTDINATVIDQGLSLSTINTLFNIDYIASYLPLKDITGATVGMLFVAEPQSVLLTTAGRAIEITFAIAAALIVLSLVPAFLVSRYIAYQLH